MKKQLLSTEYSSRDRSSPDDDVEFSAYKEKSGDRKVQVAIKRLIDICGGVTFFLVFGWLFAALYLVVKHTTGSPAIYRHKRIGRGGKEFYCLKFRTMVVNSEEVLANLLASDPLAKKEWDESFKLKNDPRITRIGRVLRKTSLDELPQFWNVLAGDMSLVGPRPVVAAELREYYGEFAKYYIQMRPGITGPWQVGGRSDLNYSERIRLDVNYVKKWSVAGDLGLILKTVGVLFQHKGSY